VAQPCTGNNLRAIDPGVTAPPTAANTLATFYVGKIVPDTGDLTNGMGLTATGYLRGGIKGQAVLPQPRLGYSWDLTGSHKTVVRGGFGVPFDRYQSGAGGAAAPPPALRFNPDAVNATCRTSRRGAGAARLSVGVTEIERELAHGVASAGIQHEIRGSMTAAVGSQRATTRAGT
jgi:hypothetical protein